MPPGRCVARQFIAGAAAIHHEPFTRGWHNADAMIRTAVDALVTEERWQSGDFCAFELAGFTSGPGEELTDELWDEIERNSEERFQREKKPSPQLAPA